MTWVLITNFKAISKLDGFWTPVTHCSLACHSHDNWLDLVWTESTWFGGCLSFLPCTLVSQTYQSGMLQGTHSMGHVDMIWECKGDDISGTCLDKWEAPPRDRHLWELPMVFLRGLCGECASIIHSGIQPNSPLTWHPCFPGVMFLFLVILQSHTLGLALWGE